MADVTTIVLSVLSSSAVVGFVTKMAESAFMERLRNSIKLEYDQKLETHKAQLRAQSDVELEQLKSKLAVSASERNIKLTRVFETQAEVIGQTYSKLHAMISAAEQYTHPMQAEGGLKLEEKRAVFANALILGEEYYKERKLYVPKNTQILIDKFLQDMRAKMTRFWLEVEESSGSAKQRDTWLELYNFASKESKEVFENLDADLKVILGLAEPPQKKDSNQGVKT